MNQLPEAVGEIARRAADTAGKTAQRATAAASDALGEAEEFVGDITDATKDGFKGAADTAKDLYRSSALKARDTLATTKEYVHRMPVRAILVTQVRVLSARTPPALFLFGAAKLYEFLQRQELAKQV